MAAVKRCSECKSLMPADAVRCTRCGSEARGAAVQGKSGPIVSKPEPEGVATVDRPQKSGPGTLTSNLWRKFLIVYAAALAGLACMGYLASDAYYVYFMLGAVLLFWILIAAYVIKLFRSTWKEAVEYGRVKHAGLHDASESASRHVNWMRVMVGLMTSAPFFLVSCTGGMLAAGLAANNDDYGPAITADRPPPKMTVVVASVPDAKAEGGRKSAIAFLYELDKFKQDNSGYSFLLPAGKGNISNSAAEMETNYEVTRSAPGAVIVKVHFHHDVPPANMDVYARYEATDKSIKILNAKYGSGLVEALVAGVVIASVLAIAGWILRKLL